MIIPLRICSAVKLDIAEKPHFKGRDAETPLFLRKTPPIPLDRQPPFPVSGRGHRSNAAANCSGDAGA